MYVGGILNIYDELLFRQPSKSTCAVILAQLVLIQFLNALTYFNGLKVMHYVLF
jgi:hypothetical protein